MKLSRQFIFEAGLMLLLMAALGWWLFFSGGVLRTHPQNAANRQAMLQIREAIQVGAGTAEVHRAFGRWRTPELRLVTDPGTLRLEMPREGSEQGWKLLVDVRDGRVESLRIRTGDGVRPKDAPGDLP